MNPPSSSFDLRASVLRVVPNVFETMLDLAAEPVVAPDASRPPEWAPEENRICAIIGIGSEVVSGMFYFHLPEGFSRIVASKMLDSELGHTAGDREVNDAVGELCNMISGGLKGDLADAGFDTAMSPPSIVRGKDFSIESEPGLAVEHFHFRCQGELLDLEIHLRVEA
jgi:chemotaxis protein CheX